MVETAPSFPEPAPTSEPSLLGRKRRFRWWLAPIWATALYLSTHQATKALIASAFMLHDEPIAKLLNKPQLVVLEAQRSIQRHFLSFGVYIPLEDIVIRGQATEIEEPTLVPLMEQSCGEGQVYVWVPLRFQLPILGEKVLEWCLVKA